MVLGRSTYEQDANRIRPLIIEHSRLTRDVVATATTVYINSLPRGVGAYSGWVVVDPYTSECEVRRVTARAGKALTLSAALTYAHTKYDEVIFLDSPTLSIKWFGALGDATTKDHAAWTAGLASLSSLGGGVLYVPGGTYALGGHISITGNNIAMQMEPYTSLVFDAGYRISITGADCMIQGHGDSSYINCTAGTSANAPVRLEGARAIVRNVKVSGNRVAGGSASGVSCIADDCQILSVRVADSGGAGIGTSGSHTIIRDCHLISTQLSGVYFASGADNGVVSGCAFSGVNIAETDGQGGIVVQGNTTADTRDEWFWFLNNSIYDAHSSGITINSGGKSPGSSYLTRFIIIRDNRIWDMGDAPQAGEGITWTADYVSVIGNMVVKPYSWGINNYRESRGCIIANNVVINPGQETESINAPFAGIRAIAEGSACTTRDMIIAGNICIDNQGTATMECGIELENGTAGDWTAGAAIVAHNIEAGSTTGKVVQLKAGAGGTAPTIADILWVDRGNLGQTGFSRTYIDGFYVNNPAGTTSGTMSRFTGPDYAADGWVAPRSGCIIGLLITSSEARTAGTFTGRVTINGSNCTFTTILNATDTTTAFNEVVPDNNASDTFATGDVIRVNWGTSSWTPTTADIRANVVIMM